MCRGIFVIMKCKVYKVSKMHICKYPQPKLDLQNDTHFSLTLNGEFTSNGSYDYYNAQCNN